MITNRVVLVRLFAVCMIALAGLSPAARAATYTWDADGGTTGPQDGAGTWNTTLQNWWNGTTNIAWSDPNTADIARFGAGSGAAGTVTVGAVQANGLTFGSAGSGNYTLSSGTITLGGSSPTITMDVNATIQSVLAGSGFTKSNAGTLILSGSLANTFTGTTTVSAGRLQLGKSNGIRAIGGDLVISGGDVRFQGTNQLASTASIQVNGAGAIVDVGNSLGQSLANVTQASTGVSNLSSWTLSGTLAVSAGTAEVNSLATSTFNTVNVSGGRLLLYAGSGATTVNVGSGGLTLTGGTVRLGNSNTANVAKLTLGGDFTSNGGGLFEAGNTTTRPQIELTGGPRTFTISGGTTTIGAGIAVTGTGGLTKAGAGLLVLGGSNTFTGDTLVNSGTLQLGNALALQNSPLDTSGAGVVALNGPTTLTLGGLKGSTALASGIASGYSGVTALTLNVTSGMSLTYAGAIANGAAGMTLTKLGSGTQVLSSSNSYTGGTQLNAGVISFGDAAALGTGTVTLGGGALQSAVAGTLANPISITATSGTFDSQGNANTLSGAITGTGGLAKAGAGTLTLSGSNSYSGGTQINAGVLALGSADAVGSTGTISFGGGTLQFSAANTTDYSNRFSTGTNQAIRLDTNGQDVNLATALSGSGSSLTKLGSGTLTLLASNSYTGGTQLNAGTLVFGNASALGTGTVTLAGGVLQSGTAGTLTNAFSITAASGTFDSQGNSNTISGVIRGTGGLVKLGSGTLTLSGAANTFSGTTTLEAGVLSLSKGSGVVSVPGDLVVNAGNVILGSANQFASTASLFVNNSGTVNAAENSNGQTVANVTYNSTAMSGLSNWTVTGTLAVASGQITFNTNQSGSFGAIRMTGGSLMPYANGSPTTINIGSGGLSMTNAVIQYGTSAYNGAGTGRVVLGGDFTSSGTNRLYKGNTNQIPQLDLGSTTRTFTITDGTTTIDTGVSVIGTGGLTKAGAGRLVLNGSNAYSGATTMSAGVLALGSAGSIASSGTVTVGTAGSTGVVLDLTAMSSSYFFVSGQRVQGIGTIDIGTGKTLSSAGIWAPGNSIGSNTVTGNLTLTGTSQFELGTAGASASSPGSSDFTAVSGTLTLGGNLALIDNANAGGLGSYGAGSYLIFTAQTVSGTFASVTPPVGASSTRVGMVYTSGTATGQGVFANVYNLASATSAQTVNVGNFHVGDTATKAVTLTNTAPGNATYTETLGSGGFSSLSTGYTATGSVTGIAGGSSGTGTLLVGFTTGSAGARNGSTVLALNSEAVNSSGLGTTAAGTQTITITGGVYNYAAANTISGSINFGTVLKGTPLSQALSISNTAPTGSYTEKLDAAFGTLTGGAVTNAGSISLLAAGGTNSSSMTAGLSSLTAGNKSGSAQVNFTSNGDGTSGLGTTSLSPQTVSLTATVLDPGLASFASGSTATTSLLLDFGSVNQNASVSPLGFSLYNLLQTSGYTADLALLNILSGTENTGAISTTLTSLFSNLAPDTFNAYTASLATDTLGSFKNVYTLEFKSANNGTAYTGDTQQNLTLTVQGVIVVPEPGAIALAGIGVVMAGWTLWRRRRIA